ncbi:cadherin-like beta sandwich domain-containing protein [Mucilaginibacter ginsenosidivorax]|uniref:T9SS type B sorting domain-containing protein n=1 Tax=Mucilaginibacter ginsenosidivorax TaxID=862126 RepID=A0A5B8W712_9SPHI|nr:cadherin-like beta sandwich domain-containing protein [Mucilaginibacter ginsenosidivorax]QEC79664.1 hypothetical protein FSB76_28295 [Mucilaginibacter ginsenosidivorax]
MKTLLPVFKTKLIISVRQVFAPLLLLIFLCVGSSSQAQVHYTTTGSATTTEVNDGLSSVNYNGTGAAAIISSLVGAPTATAIDYTGNRAFVYDNTSGVKQIKVISLTTKAVTGTITVPDVLTAMRYDAASDYIYYLTTSGANTLATNDALRKVQPNGTNDVAVVTSIANTPIGLALDLAHNVVYVLDKFASANAIKKVDFTTPATPVIVTVLSQSKSINGLDYNPNDGNIYFLQADAAGFTSKGADDAILKISGSAVSGTPTVIASSIGYQPSVFALDAGNERVFFYDGSTSASALAREIRPVSFTGVVGSAIVSFALGTSTISISALNAPRPAVTSTAAITTFSSGSATLGGQVTRSDISVTERGILYSSTNQTPTIGGSGVTKSAIGSGNGAFSGSITGLSSSTTYYVRAYGTSTAGTGYGDVVSFSTLSNDATLSGLSLSSGSLSPTFASATTSYTASVPNSTTTIAITPTRNQANATIKVNLTIVSSGSASADFNLNVGDNAQHIVVTAQDGSTKTYTVTVNRAKAAQTITFASTASKTYGDADYAPGATASSGLTVSYSSDNTAVATIVSGKIHIVAPGIANITASQAGDASNLAATSVVQALTVGKASITVTANAASKIYGDADPSLTYSITTGALAGSDAFTGALTRDAGTNIGTYNITQGTLALSASKYTLSFVTGVLTVNKRAISIQPAPASKSYGDVDPGFPYYYRVGSLASGDGMAGSYVRDPGETPGTYVLSIGTKHPVNTTTGVDQTNNYVITYIPEYLTITKRAITLQPAPATKVYGDADPGFPYYYRVGSLAPGEGMTGTFGRQAGEDVGTYVLNLGTKRPANATTGVFTDQYYTISFIPDNLTITKKTVNVSANVQSKTYGDADPVLTYAADALGFSDTFSGALTRAAGESNGTYVISQGTLTLNTTNYNLNFTGSNLTIGKKIINVTAAAQNKTYGDADPALTYTADALTSGDSFTGALTRAAGEAAGSYAISQGSLALNNNYTLNFTGNSLTIGKKVINVTANAQSKAYGDADPALTYTADALLGGDVFSGSLTRDAGEFAGSYNINQGSLTLNDNYALNFAGNSLTINKIALSYVATPVTKTYLAPNPAFTGTVTGFINGDTQATATTGTLSFTSTATDSSPQGNYPINGSGLSANNYSFVQSPANGSALTIVLSTDAALSNLSVSQGTLNTTFDAATYQYSVNVDHSTTSIDLTAVVHQANATMLINGMALTSGSAITLPLNAGDNYFTTVVTAQDGTTTKSYLVTVNRALSTNALLSSIITSGVTFNPSFDPNTTTYTAAVSNLVTGTDITATAADADANAQIGPFKITATTAYHFSLNVGDNPISVDGVAQNGDIKHYNITINRAPSSDASLSSLNTTVLTFNEPFSSTTYNYTATVANNVSQFNFVPVGTNNAAVITFNGNPVNYLGATPTINYGVNTYNIVVTSEDGTATHTYTITVTRTLSSDNNLSTLSIPFATTINEPFDPAVLNYTADLADSTITGLPLTAYSYDPNASMKINGTAVTRFANYTMTLQGGANTFNIVVTPQDNSATKTYTLVLTRAGMPPPLLSPDASLVALAISGTGYSHNFNFAFDALTPLNVANKVTGVRLSPVTGNAGATITVNNVVVTQNNSTSLLPLNLGDNTFDIVVTAADGIHQTTNTLHINRLPFADISLASLAIDAGTLNPAFVGTTFTYSASVPYSVSILNLTPVANAADATVAIGATTISAGAPSASVPLNVGLPNRIRVTVTAADGVNTQNYTVNVTRLAPDATLTSLTLSSGALSPAFDGTNTTYTASVGGNIGSVVITPTAKDPGAAVTINGSLIGTSATVPLIAGDNSFTIVVTAGDANSGIVTKTYNVTINRPSAGSNVTLTSLTTSSPLSPAFSAGISNYTAAVNNVTTTYTLIPVVNDANATVKVNGKALVSGKAVINLVPGNNVITTTITGTDGTTTNDYVIVVNKSTLSSDITMSLGMSPSASFTRIASSADGTLNYTTSVPSGTTTVMMLPKAVDPSAVITVEGVPVTSGSLSQAITLNATGATIIHAQITGGDGITTNSYSIAVSRNGSSDAGATFAMNPAASFVAVTGTANYNYTTSVPVETTSVSIVPKASNSNAIIKVNGTIVTSGSTSGPIALNATGSTNIAMTVTAQDGTLRTYNIGVSKNGSSDITMSLGMSPSASFTRIASSADGTLNYTTSVPSGTTTVMMLPKAVDPSAVITVEGVPVTSGSLSQAITLNATGATIIHAQITGGDGITTNTYSIAVSRNGSSDAGATFAMNPAASFVAVTGTANYNYTTSVPVETTSVSIVPKASNSDAIIKVNGTIVTSGSTSGPIALNATGSTNIAMTVTAQDGTLRTYNIGVSKNGSSDITMSLGMSPSASFTRIASSADGTLNYTTSVPSGTTTVMMLPKAVDPSAVITVEGVPVTSGSLSQAITLNATGATIVHAQITGGDGITTNTYSIAVSRNGSSDAGATFAMNPAASFVTVTGTANYNYTTSVPVETTSVSIVPKASNSNAIIKVNGTIVTSGSTSGPIALNATGSTNIAMTVTAQDGTLRTYNIGVSKNGSSDITMSLGMSPSASFTRIASSADGTLNYTTSVPSGTTTVMMLPKAVDPSAVITVEGIPVTSGSLSQAITLNATGATIVHAQITGGDGITTNTYSIAVSRNGSSDAGATFAMNPAASFVAVTGTANYNYTTSVPVETTSVSIVPKASNSDAIIKVNGTIVTSGSTSGPIALNATGSTNIAMTVTAQDGTLRTYNIGVSKNGSSDITMSLGMSPSASFTRIASSADGTLNYTTSVPSGTTTVMMLPKAVDPSAVITVEGVPVTSGSLSQAITLNATGATIIHAQITGGDGVTTNTYSIAVSKNIPVPSLFTTVVTGVATKSNDINSPGLTVHQALSPNSDGINDVFTIDGIENYADNRLSIMNAGGALVYDVKGYGSNGNLFDGHSNKNGVMQKPGTYYYSLEYKDGNETKRKTGYIILKY